MKKVLLISSLFLLISCKEQKVQPIEKYRGKGIIVISEDLNIDFRDETGIKVKTKDSIFYIKLTKFDAQNLKTGDTL